MKVNVHRMITVSADPNGDGRTARIQVTHVVQDVSGTHITRRDNYTRSVDTASYNRLHSAIKTACYYDTRSHLVPLSPWLIGYTLHTAA